MRRDAEAVAACCREFDAKGVTPNAALVLNTLFPKKAQGDEQG